MTTLSVSYKYDCFVVPPLVIAFARVIGSGTKFEGHPVRIFLFLIAKTTLKATFRVVKRAFLRLPRAIITLLVVYYLFTIFR